MLKMAYNTLFPAKYDEEPQNFSQKMGKKRNKVMARRRGADAKEVAAARAAARAAALMRQDNYDGARLRAIQREVTLERAKQQAADRVRLRK